MKLLFDQNLSFKLCPRLADLFPDSCQVRLLGLAEADDRALWQHAKSNGFTVIGGGHLVGLASILGIDQRFKHVSTAGGAMLSLLSGQTLPGVDALVRAAERMRNQKSI